MAVRLEGLALDLDRQNLDRHSADMYIETVMNGMRWDNVVAGNVLRGALGLVLAVLVLVLR